MRIIVFIGMMMVVVFGAMSGLSQSARAANMPFAPISADHMHDFARLPVLHEGRVKPLDSFARIMMKDIAGSEAPHGRAAIEWLALAVFDPTVMAEQQIIRTDAKSLFAQAGLSPDEKSGKYYALTDLTEILQATAPLAEELSQKERTDLTPEQEEFLRVHERAVTMTRLMRSLSLVLPLEVVLPSTVQENFKTGSVFNYYALSRLEMPLADILKDIIAAKGEDPEQYNDEEKAVALLSFQMQIMRSAAEGNALFKIIPGGWDGPDTQNWYAPWQLINDGYGSPASSRYLASWEAIALSYRAADPGIWGQAIKETQSILNGKDLYSPFKFELEILYNSIAPYNWARAFYALSFLLMGMYLMRDWPLARAAALLIMAGAMGVHVFGIMSRVIILDRPPVGTLYESVLFVALICALAGWVAALLRGQNVAAFGAALAALGLLILAPFIVPEGETLGVLVAVLNTNFWLATHVTIITAGYGMCVLAAVMAHFYMVMRLKHPKGVPQISALYKAIYKISIIALLLTAVGTVLGGIWADQSWGRFWGWDPKENGALLIVLWLIWLQHGRLSGNLRDLPFMAGIAYLNVIVGLAWFGVNLLNVGLHSYGFIQGVAVGLGAFCAIETVLIGSLWVAVRCCDKKGCCDGA